MVGPVAHPGPRGPCWGHVAPAGVWHLVHHRRIVLRGCDSPRDAPGTGSDDRSVEELPAPLSHVAHDVGGLVTTTTSGLSHPAAIIGGVKRPCRLGRTER